MKNAWNTYPSNAHKVVFQAELLQAESRVHSQTQDNGRQDGESQRNAIDVGREPSGRDGMPARWCHLSFRLWPLKVPLVNE